MIEINTSRKGKKNRMKSHYRSQDAYKYYKSRYGNPHNLTQGMYGSIFKDFIEAVTDKMLFENLQFEFPGGLGVFSIRKRKKILRLYPDGSLDTRNLRVDYKSTVALWRKDEEAYIEHKKIYYLNKHTDRYYYKFYWDKTICVTPNNSVYAFKPAKSLKLKLTRLLNSQHENIDFYELYDKK